MRFTINKNTFREALSVSSSVCPKTTPKEILKGIKIEVVSESDWSGLRLYSSDGQINYRGECSVLQIEEYGAVVVEGQNLNNIVSSMDNDNVSVVLTSDNEVEVQSGKAKFILPTFDVDNFPDISNLNMSNPMEIEVDKLSWLLEKTSFASSTDAARLFLHGVYVTKRDDCFSAVSTDGHRMALAECRLDGAYELPNKVLPSNLISVLSRAYSKNYDIVYLDFNNDGVVVGYGDHRWSSPYCQGDFPNYEMIIPRNPSIDVTVNRKNLIDAVSRVSLMAANEKGMRFSLRDGEFEISAHNAGKGKGHDIVSASGQGELEIGLDCRYILGALNALDSSEVKFQATNHLSPILLKPCYDDSEASDQYHVVMPMRL